MSECRYRNFKEAQIECAEHAIEQGVLSFIQDGGIQIKVEPDSPSVQEKKVKVEQDPTSHIAADYQETYCVDGLSNEALSISKIDSFLKLFSKADRDAMSNHVDAVAAVSNVVSLIKDPQLQLHFAWTKPISSNSTTCKSVFVFTATRSQASPVGSVITLERYTCALDTIAYLLEPRFTNKKCAKIAVYMFAVIRGILKLIHEAKKDMLELDTLNPKLTAKASEALVTITNAYERVFKQSLPIVDTQHLEGKCIFNLRRMQN